MSDYFSTLVEYVAHFKAHGINKEPGKGLQTVLNFQDHVGRQTILQTVDEIIGVCNTSAEVSLDHICWAMAATLDMTTAGEIIKAVMWRLQGQRLEEKIRAENEALLEQERQALEDLYCRKTQKVLDECQRQKDRFNERARRLSQAEAERDKLEEQLATVRKAIAILNAA
jgi:hypothetical protein